MTVELSRDEKAMRHSTMSMEERKKLWLSISDITEAEFDALWAHQQARQADVPRPGSKAPDFELDILDRERLRTGETVRLSSQQGKPVALLFGSYT